MKGLLRALLYGLGGFCVWLVMEYLELTATTKLFLFILLVYFGLGWEHEKTKDRIADLEWRLDELEHKKSRR